MACGKCGQDDDYYATIEVIMNEGEEGFADILMYVCQDCLVLAQDMLRAFGFKDHRHGSTNFLEDTECPGDLKMDDCPTPTEYGQVVLGSWEDY